MARILHIAEGRGNPVRPGVALIVLVCGAISLGFTAGPASAEDSEVGGSFARAVSDSAYALWGLSAGYYLLRDDPYDVETGRRVVDALLLAGGVTELLKSTVSSRRPAPHDPNTRGMPSGHATLSFAVAAAISEREPDLAVPAYAWAAMIGWSRRQTRQHYWDQVLVGAALGCVIGRNAGQAQWRILGHEQERSLSVSLRATPEERGDCCRAMPALVFRTSF